MDVEVTSTAMDSTEENTGPAAAKTSIMQLEW